jgi:hypothetical protein
LERERSNKVDDSFTSGLGAESVVVAATDVSVFGGSLDSSVGDDSGCEDAGKVDSLEPQAQTKHKNNNITVIRAFWSCLRLIIYPKRALLYVISNAGT